MKILVVGGTGVLSSAVVQETLKQNFKVTMINRGNRNVPNSVTLIKTDKNNYNDIELQLCNQQFDAVIDFLCYTPEDVRNSFSFYSKYTKQFIFISSCAVYDKLYTGKKHIESDPKPLQIWSYSVNKWKAEQELERIAARNCCNYTIVRPSITYGNTRIPYGISPQYGYHWTLAARVLSDKPIIRWNEGQNHYNMLRVEDFAHGFVGLIGNSKAYNEAFNICSDDTPTFNDVLVAMGKALNHEVKTIDIAADYYAKEYPSRAEEILGGRAQDEINSNEKIKSLVPYFSQTISLEDGVRMTIDAYRKENYQHGIDWTFDADTDRIIKKWCKQQGINWHQYHLGFVDYLGTATFQDKKSYWMEFYKEEWILITLIRCVNKLKRIKGKVKRIIKKMV